jgi:hypothetical protein
MPGRLEHLHERSLRNRAQATWAETAGCFHCLKEFPVADITDWAEEADGQQTALCPHCKVDAVSMEATTEELAAMQRNYFGFTTPPSAKDKAISAILCEFDNGKLHKDDAYEKLTMLGMTPEEAAENINLLMGLDD